MLKHCVFVNFQTRYSKVERNSVLAGFAEVANDVPGLLDFCFGANLGFENKSADYGDGFIVTFKDRDAHLAYERRQGNANRVLHQHMDHKKPQVIAQRIPKLIRPNWVTEKGLKILQPHIQTRLIYFGKKCQPQSIEQRIDHYGSIDENCSLSGD